MVKNRKRRSSVQEGCHGELEDVGCLTLRGWTYDTTVARLFKGPKKEASVIDSNLFLFFLVCRSASKEREKKVGCGDVRIFTYFYLFSDESASFFDLTRSSFFIFF